MTGSGPDDIAPPLGPDSVPTEDGRERRCIVSGEVLPEDRLIRFVAGPDATVFPDMARKLPGRGIWVEAKRASIEAAVRKAQFSRAAKTKLTAAPDLADLVERLLVKRCLEQLGLARREGGVVPGFEKTHAALSRGKLELIVEASDASRGGSERLASQAIPRITVLSRGELGYAFGRDELVHVGILDATWAARLNTEAARLAGFRRPATQDPT
jgi:predicted RNA-binding protein YlxR (DUF448 family)